MPGRSATGSLLALVLLLAGCKSPTGSGKIGEVSCPAPTTVVAGRTTIPVAPNGYAAVGNRIISVATCEPYRFAGVSWPSLLLLPDFTNGADHRLTETRMAEDFARIKSWKANTVRIELSQNFWVPTARDYNPRYPGLVEAAVRHARAAGLNVILALQHSDRGDPNYPGKANPQQPMADVNHSIPFWKDVASRFKNDGGVLFEVFSEPYPVEPKNPGGFSNWDVWLNGGMVPGDSVYEPRAPFQAAGMRQLYEAVRSTGANNIVILSGTLWGYFLDGVPRHRVKGHNIAYSAHPWDYPRKQPATWDKDFGFLARTDPVMLTEFGSYNCQTGYTQAVLDYADKHQLSWVAWAWMAPPEQANESQRRNWICTFPMLITDWSGAPSVTGEVVKSRLSSY